MKVPRRLLQRKAEEAIVAGTGLRVCLAGRKMLSIARRSNGKLKLHSYVGNVRGCHHLSDSFPLDFLNHYFDSLRYLNDRKSRTQTFKDRFQLSDIGETQSLPQGGSELVSYLGRERAHLRKRRTKMRLNSFHIITQVGQGGYGEVFLARRRETGEVCALKRLRKRVLVKMDEVRHVLTERDILTATKSPWLVRLLYAFQDMEHVFLAMEYVPGGDFRTLLNNSGVLREEHARFYAAEMFVAVNELHVLGYIHRDLKPEVRVK